MDTVCTPVYVPVDGVMSGGEACAMNVYVSVKVTLKVNVQPPPVQAPALPVPDEVTVDPAAGAPAHVTDEPTVGAEVPNGQLLTDPLPVPFTVTVNEAGIGAETVQVPPMMFELVYPPWQAIVRQIYVPPDVIENPPPGYVVSPQVGAAGVEPSVVAV